MWFALLPQHNARLSSSVLSVSSTLLPDVSSLRMRDPHLLEDPVYLEWMPGIKKQLIYFINDHCFVCVLP